MYSNIADAEYTYVEMKASSLKQKLIDQEKLSVLDIAKGYHTKWPIKLKYSRENMPTLFSSECVQDIDTIQKEAKRFVYEEFETIVKNKAEERQQILFSEIDKIIVRMKEDGCDEYKGEDARACVLKVINDRNWDTYPYPFKYYQEINKLYYKYEITDDDVRQIIREHINGFLASHFGEKYSVSKEAPKLPSNIDYNEVLNIDFSNIYMPSNEYLFGTVGTGSQARGTGVKIVYGSEKMPLDGNVFGNINLAYVGTPEISVKMSENEARLAFESALFSKIDDSLKMGENEYFRNTEFSPVIVNQNTKTGKLELIDGYRRILTVSDPNLLDTTIPVKAYKDLSDNQFLSVLFAANMWKNDFNDRDIVAFDRGFLFALKQRFGFEIPERAAQLESEMTHDVTFSSIPHELSLLYLYRNFSVEQMKNHNHYVDDIKTLYSTLLDCYFTKYPYDHQYNVELSKFIAKTVGRIREAEGEEPQSSLSAEIIESLFTDEYLTKLFSKKVYSSSTHVENFFRDKGVYGYVESKLKDSLIPKEMPCDKDDEEEYEK